MAKTEETKLERYVEGTGRRKTAVARVRMTPSNKSDLSKEKNILVNGKTLETYFQDPEHQKMAKEIFDKVGVDAVFSISVKVIGGGLSAQAEAVRHGIARSLLAWNPELKSILRGLGFLQRDSRMRERKKFGLRRARRARQWRKR